MTIDDLKAFGANTDEGLTRCFNKDAFYIRLVKTVPNEGSFAKLAEALGQNDLQAGFEYAHALKGVLSNLALTPILTPVSEITELLRAGTEMDYGPLMAEIEAQRAKLEALCAD